MVQRLLSTPAIDGFFDARQWQILPFQRAAWQAYADGESMLIHAATGQGKTLAAWLGPLAEASDAQEPLRVLWLTPSMDGLFTGPANDRRRFLDRLVTTLVPRHSTTVGDYDKAMRQRNAMFEQGRIDDQWAEAVEARMAEAGAAIATYRARACGDMQAAINARPDGLFPKADLALEGRFEEMAGDGADAAQAGIDENVRFARRIAAARQVGDADGGHEWSPPASWSSTMR